MNAVAKRKSGFFPLLMALPFGGFAIWMLVSILLTLYDAVEIRDWQRIDATLLDGGYKVVRGDDSDSEQAYARYQYQFNGVEYEGDRVALSAGADNIGDFQKRLGNRLKSDFRAARKIEIFVDADAPSNSIIDPTIRWGLLAFKFLFVAVFGAIGGGLAYSALAKKSKPQIATDGKPWQADPDWSEQGILSNARLGAKFAPAFALFWNLLSMPLIFVVYREVIQKKNLPALMALLFPLIGIYLLIWAYRQIREWRRFNAAPLILDPYPGSIGGEVGGYIRLKTQFHQAQDFWITLTQLRTSRNSKGESRENAEWQDKMLAQSESSASGTKINFLFDVPAELPESQPRAGTLRKIAWRINLSGDLIEGSVDRDYDIPCFATSTQSRYLRREQFDAVAIRQRSISEESVKSLANFSFDQGGQQIHYAIGRNIGLAFGLLIMALVFGGAGVFIGFAQDAPIFGGIFVFIAAIVFICSLYTVGNSLTVRRQGSALSTVRRWFGLPIRRRRLSLDAIQQLVIDTNMQSSSGKKHTVHYHIDAIGMDDARLRLSEGIKGRAESRAAVNLIVDTLSLPSRLRRANEKTRKKPKSESSRDA